MITLVDTSELKRPIQRKLHAAWRELQGERVLATPGVADELAPLATNVLWHEGPSEAEHTLQNRTLPDPRRRQLQQQAWWDGCGQTRRARTGSSRSTRSRQTAPSACAP